MALTCESSAVLKDDLIFGPCFGETVGQANLDFQWIALPGDDDRFDCAPPQRLSLMAPRVRHVVQSLDRRAQRSKG
jgi:hypothetical protein